MALRTQGGRLFGARVAGLDYLIATGVVAVAAAARVVFDPLLGEQAAAILFIPAVMIAAIRGGVGPAIFATALSAVSFLGLLAWSRGHLALAPSVWITLGLFGVVSLGVVGLSRSLQAMRQRAEERESRLRSILDTVPDAMVVIDEHGI